MEWFLLAWKRATDFAGRSRRKEYWMFQLFNFLIVCAIFLVAVSLSGRDGVAIATDICFAYCLLSFIPQLSCTVRRLHDTGKSGWWYLISFVPLIGGIILFIFMVLDSDPDRNQYGPNPKWPAAGQVVI
jgi:uncharacterized membrane protein YhaH (DUF805 family)